MGKVTWFTDTGGGLARKEDVEIVIKGPCIPLSLKNGLYEFPVVEDADYVAPLERENEAPEREKRSVTFETDDQEPVRPKTGLSVPPAPTAQEREEAHAVQRPPPFPPRRARHVPGIQYRREKVVSGGRRLGPLLPPPGGAPADDGRPLDAAGAAMASFPSVPLASSEAAG